MSTKRNRSLSRILSQSALAATATALCATAFSAAAAPAQPERNPYAPAYQHGYRHGAVPTRELQAAMKQWQVRSIIGKATSANTLFYRGGTGGVGVLSGQSKVYLIFYGSQWGTSTADANGVLSFSNDAAGAGPAAQKMFKGIGTNGELWSAELTQWCDGPGVATGASSCPATGIARIPYQQNVLAGVWYDNTVASPAGATPAQLAAEANKAAAHFGNTTAASNRYTYYVILSPTGTNPDNYKSPTNGYCAWHDYVGDPGISTPTTYGPLAFSNQPYNIDVGSSCGTNFVNAGTAGKLDGYTMTLGHEWHEMMSDQFPAGGWTANSGQENSDECAWIAAGSAGGAANVAFSTGTFAQQASWSNDTNSCAISHAIVTGGSTNTAPVANFTTTSSGLTATFTDTSTDAENNISTHSWTFGDGSTSTATSPSHTYAAAGTYSVSETVTDTGGLSSTKTVSVTVSGGGGTCGGTVLCSGTAVALPSVATGSWSPFYTIAVPAGKTSVVFNISGGTGDADLYVRIGSAPTTTTYNCRPYTTGNAETCTFNAPTAGTYYVGVRAYAAYSGVSLKATISP